MPYYTLQGPQRGSGITSSPTGQDDSIVCFAILRSSIFFYTFLFSLHPVQTGSRQSEFFLQIETPLLSLESILYYYNFLKLLLYSEGFLFTLLPNKECINNSRTNDCDHYCWTTRKSPVLDQPEGPLGGGGVWSALYEEHWLSPSQSSL